MEKVIFNSKMTFFAPQNAISLYSCIMRRIHIPTGTAIVMIFWLLPAAFTMGQTMVTYIANEGVMISNGKSKVLIDPFFNVGFNLYQTPRIDNLNLFLEKHPSLRDADLILITHRHADHIDPHLVAEYLKLNSKTKLISSSQASDSLVNQFGISNNRIVNILPKMNQELLLIPEQRVDVKAAWMRHGNERNFGVVNLCFLTKLGDKKVLHLGDSEINPDSFTTVDFSTEKIDVLLAPYWWLMGPYGPVIIKEKIKPKKIVAFHVAADYATVKDEIIKNFPDVTFFDTAFSSVKVD